MSGGAEREAAEEEGEGQIIEDNEPELLENAEIDTETTDGD